MPTRGHFIFAAVFGVVLTGFFTGIWFADRFPAEPVAPELTSPAAESSGRDITGEPVWRLAVPDSARQLRFRIPAADSVGQYWEVVLWRVK